MRRPRRDLRVEGGNALGENTGHCVKQVGVEPKFGRFK